MIRKNIQEKLIGILSGHGEIAFAYMHGSSIDSSCPDDIDIAVFLFSGTDTASVDMDFSIPLEYEIERALKKKTDVQVINRSPLPFRYRVVSQGVLLIDRAPDLRENFELLSRVEYFDFQPRREEYLKEALA
jgi:uncharacterized protein